MDNTQLSENHLDLANKISSNSAQPAPAFAIEDECGSEPSSANVEKILCKVSHPARTLYYPSLDKCVTLETDLQVT